MGGNIKPGQHIEAVTGVVHSGGYTCRFTIHENNVSHARQRHVPANGAFVLGPSQPATSLPDGLSGTADASEQVIAPGGTTPPADLRLAAAIGSTPRPNAVPGTAG